MRNLTDYERGERLFVLIWERIACDIETVCRDDPPLIRLGQGDYVKDWTPKEKHDGSV